MKLLSTFSIVAILLFFSITGGHINSQTPDLEESFSNNTDLLFYCRPSLETELEGKDFLDSTWQESIVRTQTNKTFQVKSRYRVVSDDIQILYNEMNYTLLNNHIDAVEIGSHLFKPKSYNEKGRDLEGYLQIVFDGQISLYKRFMKSNTGVVGTSFYVSRGEETPVRLDTRKKMVIRYLKDRKVAMYNYIQVHKLKTDNEEDLRQIFEYYNSL